MPCCPLYRGLLAKAPTQKSPRKRPISSRTGGGGRGRGRGGGRAPNGVRRCANEEVAAEAVSACTALCCCPIAVLHLIFVLLLVYPCAFLVQRARRARARCRKANAERRKRSEKEERSSLPLIKEDEAQDREVSSAKSISWTKRVELSFGFFMRFRGETMEFRYGFECCVPQVPAGVIKRKFGEWKEKRLSALGKRRIRPVHGKGYEGLESPASSIRFSEGEGEGEAMEIERGAEVGTGFEHPFWKECFEGVPVGFWRGLNLCDSAIRRMHELDEFTACPGCGITCKED